MGWPSFCEDIFRRFSESVEARFSQTALAPNLRVYSAEFASENEFNTFIRSAFDRELVALLSTLTEPELDLVAEVT